MKYNVYCDESCHLQKDNSDVMILGAMYCLEENKVQIYSEIRDLKRKYGLDPHFEIKWTKVSESKIDFYLELLNYFIKNNNLSYRVLVATGKGKLDHVKYNAGSYDLWYYKMYFLMLNPIINPENEYHILVDIKDTNGGRRVDKLREVLCNNRYDFKQEVINQIGQINSKESEILQLVDLINGAIGFYNRNLDEKIDSNKGKIKVVNELTKIWDLDHHTPKNEQKFNMFIWQPRT